MKTQMKTYQGSQFRSSTTFKQAKTNAVDVDGVKFAYRQLGPDTGVPVIFLNHLAAELDRWDPRVVDGIASKHRVIVFDNRGIGASEGSTPGSVAAMARDAVAFIRALGLESVDLLGFSLGGFISQVIAQEEPQLVRKIILAGTGPAGGPGIDKVTSVTIKNMIKGALTFKHPEYYLFFTTTANGRRSASEFLKRLKERTENRDKTVSITAFISQLKAIHAWGIQEADDLSLIQQPVLVANGESDKMVPSSNSVDLARRLPNAELVLYPDAGHGGIFSITKLLSKRLSSFSNHKGIMKAFIIDRYGSKDGGRIGEMPEPRLLENDVLVQVHAAGINVLDNKIKDGEFKLILPYSLPLILGNDVAGVVVGIGSRVRRFKHGDEVYARPDKGRIGAFAEFISMNEDDVAIKPKDLTMEEAASVPLVGLTAWQALIEKANLKRGQKVLIHAGSGGVGTFAIQLAKHVGATVATTTSAANFDLVKGLGADIVIDYKKEDFEKILHDYDVVLDTLGGETQQKSLRVLKPGGKLIGITGPPDPDFARDIGLSCVLRLVMRLLSYRIRKKAKRHHVSYLFLFMRASGDQLREIASLIDSGIIRPVVDRVFPFESTKDAMAYVETGRAKGKVVVKVR